jgi:hypothetical protein
MKSVLSFWLLTAGYLSFNDLNGLDEVIESVNQSVS